MIENVLTLIVFGVFWAGVVLLAVWGIGKIKRDKQHLLLVVGTILVLASLFLATLWPLLSIKMKLVSFGGTKKQSVTPTIDWNNLFKQIPKK